jgi:pyridoxine 4-dehydrogenase
MKASTLDDFDNRKKWRRTVGMIAPKTFTIANDKQVRRLGYGAMRLTGQPGNFGPYPDWEGGKELLRHAVDLGVNFIDTARAYGPGWNERLVADALHPYSPELLIATKGGVVKRSATERYLDGSPDGLRRDCEESLKNLRIDQIYLYQLHWVDPNTPLADSVSGLAKLREEGKIRNIGLSNIVLDQLKEAALIVDIASVQNRFSILEKKDGEIVDFCAAKGIAFLPYGPLGGDPFERGSPLTKAEGALANFSAMRNATTTQIAITWLLHRSANTIVIPGTTSIQHLEENIAAADLELGEEEMTTLSSFGAIGTP